MRQKISICLTNITYGKFVRRMTRTKFKGIKTATEYRRGELAKDILRLVAAGVVVGTAMVAAPNTLQLLDYFDPKGRRERNRIWNAIHYSERHGDVSVTK